MCSSNKRGVSLYVCTMLFWLRNKTPFFNKYTLGTVIRKVFKQIQTKICTQIIAIHVLKR